ncbi:MAG: STAS domain-containing protein [Byssovorax sp.]
MSEAITVEILTQLLRRVPGASWSCRIKAGTGTGTWIYVDARAAEIFGVPEAELRANPSSSMQQVIPEDRARVDAAVAQSFQTLAPIVWTGQVASHAGDLRWIEGHLAFEREADGSIIMYGQVFDISERKRLEQALRDSEETRRKADVLHRTVLDALPVGVMLANQERELVIYNPAQQRMVGGLAQYDDGNLTGAYGIFLADGETPLPMEDSGLVRALRGESVVEEVVIRNPRLDAPVRQHITWTPLRDESGDVYASLGLTQDITLQRNLETELRLRNAELAASEEAKTQLIDRLRYSIDELSNPILEVWDDVLVMPIIGVVDARRTADMVQRLLTEVARSQASFVIVDLTGVEIVDTKTADHLLKLIRKVETVGARCVLTGIRPAVAETLVDIGVDFGRITTLRNLKHGLREAMHSARREVEGAQSNHGLDQPRSDDSSRRRRTR